MIKYIDKKNTYIDDSVQIGDGTIIYPNVMLEGNTKIGKNCIIHMGNYIKDTIIGDNCVVYSSFILESRIGKNCKIGPYSHIRPNNIISDNVKVGSFVELKNDKIAVGSKVPHLSYVGDTEIGKKVNIGAGTITANYDGKNKFKTIIGDNAFVGSNSTLIAPVKVEEKALIAAGSTITNDVPKNNLAIARQRQENKDRK